MRTALPILLVILVALAIVLWLLPRERRADVAPPFVRPAALEPLPAPEVQMEAGPSRFAIESAEGNTPAETPAVTTLSPGASLSGRFVFEDGTIPPELSFYVLPARLEAGETQKQLPDEARAARAEGRCVRWDIEQTGADGAFEVSGLCALSYRFDLISFRALGALSGTYAAPARDLKVVLPGHLLKVTVVDDGAKPVARADVVVRFLPAQSNAQKGPVEAVTHLWSDAQGDAWLGLGEAGTIRLGASAGVRYSAELDLTVGGASGLVSSTLTLDRSLEGARLAVSLSVCGSPRTPVDSYCLAFFDAVDGRQVFRLCSENVDADGVFRQLAPGRYQVSAVPRFAADPVMYRTAKGGLRTPVELIDQRETRLELCVEMGGRLAVSISGPEGADLGRVQAKVELDANDGSKPQRVSFREPDAEGVTISIGLPAGVRRLTEDVLRPGTYSLRAKADAWNSPEQVVTITAGQVTEVDVRLVAERR